MKHPLTGTGGIEAREAFRKRFAMSISRMFLKRGSSCCDKERLLANAADDAFRRLVTLQ